jgi:hypothetical protein
MQTSLGIGLGITQQGNNGGGTPVTYYLLKEDGDALLLETGDRVLKEDSP